MRIEAGSPKKVNDQLLDVAEAAEKLGVSKDWLYSRTDTPPFVLRLGRKVRFSERGIERYIMEQSSMVMKLSLRPIGSH